MDIPDSVFHAEWTNQSPRTPQRLQIENDVSTDVRHMKP